MWPFKKRRSDEDIEIDILQEATRRSYSDEPFQAQQYGAAELPIVRDLLDSEKIRGETMHVEGGIAITLEGINLEGRQLRDELLEKRKARRLSSRLAKFGLVAIGWIASQIWSLISEYLKAKITHPH